MGIFRHPRLEIAFEEQRFDHALVRCEGDLQALFTRREIVRHRGAHPLDGLRHTDGLQTLGAEIAGHDEARQGIGGQLCDAVKAREGV